MDDSFAGLSTIVLVVLLDGARLATVPVRLPRDDSDARGASTVSLESVLTLVRHQEGDDD